VPPLEKSKPVLETPASVPKASAPAPMPAPKTSISTDDGKMRIMLSNFFVPNYQVYYGTETFNPYAPQQVRQEYTSAYFERIINEKLSLLRNPNELRKKYRIDKVLDSLEKYEDIIDDYNNIHEYDRSYGERKHDYEQAIHKIPKRIDYLKNVIKKLDKEKLK
jgi:hypothetical protein